MNEQQDIQPCHELQLVSGPKRDGVKARSELRGTGPASSLPVPNAPIDVRPATKADLPWIDALHKKHSKQLGYATTKQFEGYIELGGLLIAEGARSEERGVRQNQTQNQTQTQTQMQGATSPASGSCLAPHSSLLAPSTPLGYVMYRDRYLKRDELGVVYQLCVDPNAQRTLIGATLLKEVFERSAYGCRLFCCWCAQDLPANRFWEAMGFVPIAFRGGSTKKKRVHIFWQKKIVEGDTETRWWYPSKTEGGQMREDRLALPIPPGLHWSEPMPVIVSAVEEPPSAPKQITKKPRAAKAKPTVPPSVQKKAPLQFGPPPTGASSTAVEPQPVEVPTVVEAKPVAKKPKLPPIDPALIRQARELRDRYLEQVNRPEHANLLESGARYAVAKLLPTGPMPTMKRLAA
jgi:ribosomal protein S18 acetylase RimI-like enzyme